MTKKSGDTLSIVIPFFNDEELVRPLYERLKEVFGDDEKYEFILIDDGSSDRTFEGLKSLCKEDHRFRAVRLNRNWGQRKAITEGMKIMRGKLAATMDPDLQNDPEVILKLAGLMTFGTEMVSGYRVKRNESLIRRRLPSFITNRLLALASGVRMKDFGCPMAVFRTGLVRETIQQSPSRLFSKTLAAMLAGSVRETPISHIPRQRGKSSYTFMRLVKMFHFRFFSALELRLIRAGLSPEIIKAGLIWALMVNGLFVAASLMVVPYFAILFLCTFFIFAAFAQSVRKNDRRRRDPDPVAEIV